MPEAERLKRTGRRRIRSILQTALLCALVLCALLSATPEGRRFWRSAFAGSGFTPPTDAPLSVHVIDVGKADAILIQCEGSFALIDAGTYLNGETVSDYLTRCGVEQLDYAIVSHPDKDHLGGMDQVLREIGADQFVRSKYHADQYGSVEDTLTKNKIPQRTVGPGGEFELGGAILQVLGPVKEYTDTNNSSLVLRLEYQGFTALFCGDIEKEAEKDLVKSGADLSADLFKVPHHGSKTSSTKRLLKAVDPQYAVISVGRDRNNLPDEKTLIRLEEAGVEEVYRTDTDGTVVFCFDGDAIGILTEKS